ncbi:hypothetical protein [Amycolatopsis sp. DSM 110486]|uniref:DUF6959 family protein n=1 Tax=Amycolatopsis sp. DSM 110486 TaxID=2865832 RepID=UPI001C69E588|nr:hypothetical protein [Amycolatopsis sp. DSM 110486]QYN18924.1 hypothetical protein K1T34_40550 [Amycolatopsis sp. DSM 110486]
MTVQGDSLKAIEQAVDELKSLVDPSGESHLAASVEEVSELLSAFIEEYEDMMAEAKITLPYQ